MLGFHKTTKAQTSGKHTPVGARGGRHRAAERHRKQSPGQWAAMLALNATVAISAILQGSGAGVVQEVQPVTQSMSPEEARSAIAHRYTDPNPQSTISLMPKLQRAVTPGKKDTISYGVKVTAHLTPSPEALQAEAEYAASLSLRIGKTVPVVRQVNAADDGRLVAGSAARDVRVSHVGADPNDVNIFIPADRTKSLQRFALYASSTATTTANQVQEGYEKPVAAFSILNGQVTKIDANNIFNPSLHVYQDGTTGGSAELLRPAPPSAVSGIGSKIDESRLARRQE